jgi:hypothetical protein
MAHPVRFGECIVGAHGCAPLPTPRGRMQGAQPCAPTHQGLA